MFCEINALRNIEHDDILIRADILAKKADGTWALHEVKSTTKVKKEHYIDTAVQAYVLEQSGLRPSSVNLVYLNGDFVRQGDIDPQQLFVIEPLDEHEKFLEARSEVAGYVAQIFQSIHADGLVVYFGLASPPKPWF